jgi:hypothetical protein
MIDVEVDDVSHDEDDVQRVHSANAYFIRVPNESCHHFGLSLLHNESDTTIGLPQYAHPRRFQEPIPP